MSYDGSVVAGWTAYPATKHTGQLGFRWTAQGGTEYLPTDTYAFATPGAMSPDGRVLAGTLLTYHSDTGYFDTAVARWPEDGSVEVLVAFPSNLSSFYPADMGDSADLIVGYGEGKARIWTHDKGIEDLQDVFIAAGLNLDGWFLTTATGISADGLTYAGTGINPLGQTEAWIATIPAPSSVLPLIAGAICWPRRR